MAVANSTSRAAICYSETSTFSMSLPRSLMSTGVVSPQMGSWSFHYGSRSLAGATAPGSQDDLLVDTARTGREPSGDPHEHGDGDHEPQRHRPAPAPAEQTTDGQGSDGGENIAGGLHECRGGRRDRALPGSGGDGGWAGGAEPAVSEQDGPHHRRGGRGEQQTQVAEDGADAEGDEEGAWGDAPDDDLRSQEPAGQSPEGDDREHDAGEDRVETCVQIGRASCRER